MKRILSSVAFATVISAISMGQVVRLEQHDSAADVWGNQFNVRRQMTFSGRVSGIEKTRPASATDDETTIFVKNKDGGGTAVIDLGPSWYVASQDAKIRVGDLVQVTGSKTMVDGHGLILASQVVVNGRGGPVLALRRISGKAYWLGNRVAQNSSGDIQTNIPNGPANNTASSPAVPTGTGIGYLPTNGYTNYDPGPWYYGQPNTSYQVGYGANVVTGSNPVYVNPYVTLLPYWSTFQSPIFGFSNGFPMYR